MYNSFGVRISGSGISPSPYEWMSNWRNGASHGTLTFKNAFYYPELGRNLQGRFSLTFFNGGVRPQPCLVEVTIGPGLPGGGEGGYGCGGGGAFPIPPWAPSVPQRERCIVVSAAGSPSAPPPVDVLSGGMPVCLIRGDGDGPPPCPGNNCSCNYDQMAAIPEGYSGGMVQTTLPGPGMIDPCKCKLVRKCGASGSQMADPGGCCFQLDCNGTRFDIFNDKVDDVRRGCCKKGGAGGPGTGPGGFGAFAPGLPNGQGQQRRCCRNEPDCRGCCIETYLEPLKDPWLAVIIIIVVTVICLIACLTYPVVCKACVDAALYAMGMSPLLLGAIALGGYLSCIWSCPGGPWRPLPEPFEEEEQPPLPWQLYYR